VAMLTPVVAPVTSTTLSADAQNTVLGRPRVRADTEQHQALLIRRSTRPGRDGARGTHSRRASDAERHDRTEDQAGEDRVEVSDQSDWFDGSAPTLMGWAVPSPSL
jgi:hypothetical protein